MFNLRNEDLELLGDVHLNSKVFDAVIVIFRSSLKDGFSESILEVGSEAGKRCWLTD